MMRQMNPESLKGMASLLQQYGRNGDTILAHINPKEAMLLDRVSGGGSMNPMTGMPEFFDVGEAVGEAGSQGPSEEGDDDEAGGGMGMSEIGRDPDGTVAGEALGDAAIMGTFDPVSEAEAQAAYGVPVDQDITVSYDGGQGIGGFFDSVGNFLGKAGTTLGGIVTNALENPFSTLADLAISKSNPIGAVANYATQALTGRSIAAHASDVLNATMGTAKTDQQPIAQALNEFATNLGQRVDNLVGTSLGGIQSLSLPDTTPAVSDIEATNLGIFGKEPEPEPEPMVDRAIPAAPASLLEPSFEDVVAPVGMRSMAPSTTTDFYSDPNPVSGVRDSIYGVSSLDHLVSPVDTSSPANIQAKVDAARAATEQYNAQGVPPGSSIDQDIIDMYNSLGRTLSAGPTLPPNQYANMSIKRAQGGPVSLDALYNNVRARRGPITGGQRSGGGIMSLR